MNNKSFPTMKTSNNVVLFAPTSSEPQEILNRVPRNSKGFRISKDVYKAIYKMEMIGYIGAEIVRTYKGQWYLRDVNCMSNNPILSEKVSKDEIIVEATNWYNLNPKFHEVIVDINYAIELGTIS